MRIDEFSNAAGIDGAISTAEQTQFLLFGFDIDLAAAVPVATFYETLEFNSQITTILEFNSQITTTLAFDSPIGD